MVPKLFGPIRERYASRPGGYTRILRIEPMKEDQAESAILELVDGPRDMRFALTAKTLARLKPEQKFSPVVARHVQKVTQFREDGVEELKEMVERLRIEHKDGMDDRILPPPRKVYPEEKRKREMHYMEETDDYKYPNAWPKQKLKAKSDSKELEVVEGEGSSQANEPKKQLS